MPLSIVFFSSCTNPLDQTLHGGKGLIWFLSSNWLSRLCSEFSFSVLGSFAAVYTLCEICLCLFHCSFFTAGKQGWES